MIFQQEFWHLVFCDACLMCADYFAPFGEIEIDFEETESERTLRLRREAQREAIAALAPNPAHHETSWRFFREQLGSPRYWCAPMVGASELAFRMMVRKYGASIATTPMIAAGGYVQSASYREQFKFLSGPDALKKHMGWIVLGGETG